MDEDVSMVEAWTVGSRAAFDFSDGRTVAFPNIKIQNASSGGPALSSVFLCTLFTYIEQNRVTGDLTFRNCSKTIYVSRIFLSPTDLCNNMVSSRTCDE